MSGAFASSKGSYVSVSGSGVPCGASENSFRASRSNPIYGASDTVQPNALTTRFIIKAFDGQTPDSALIDITQYAQELARKANITGSNLVHHKDVITTSGTYTAPATGLYKITVKGGGGGGSGSSILSTSDGKTGLLGGSGGEGGTTIGFEKMTVGDTATVIIGAGGAGGAAGNNDGTAGGDTSVTVNNNTYIGGGGQEGRRLGAGRPGTGTIPGAYGVPPYTQVSPAIAGASTDTRYTVPTGKGAGSGGAGGPVMLAGNYSTAKNYVGYAGSDGVAIFEYYTPGA